MIEKGGEFYKRSLKSCLHDNDIEIYSKQNGENDRFIRTLQNRIYKYIT